MCEEPLPKDSGFLHVRIPCVHPPYKYGGILNIKKLFINSIVMFCIKCGKDAEVGNFCNKCFLEDNELFDIDSLVFYFCRGCDGYFLKNRKVSVEGAVKSGIKTKNNIKKIEIKERVVGNKIYVTVTCSGLIKPCRKIKKEEKKILITIKKQMCDTCIRLAGGYYEAMFQVRGDNKERVFKKLMALSKKVPITSVGEIKEGYDIKFVNKKDAAYISRLLKKKFEVKDTYKLVGEKKGKKLYRNFYVVR